MPRVNIAPTDLDRLVTGLEDLARGPEAQLLLIACGPAAIPPLARYLAGPPALHPQPRLLAAQALGAIGGPAAVRALGAALVADSFERASPVVRLVRVGPRAVRPLARMLVDATSARAPVAVLHAGARTLARLGPEGTSALAALVHHEEPLLRSVALAHVPVDVELGRALLEQARRDPDARVRRTAEARRRRGRGERP